MVKLIWRYLQSVHNAQINQDFWKRVKIVHWLDQKVNVFWNYRLDHTTPVVFQNAPPTNSASMLYDELWTNRATVTIFAAFSCAVMAGIRKASGLKKKLSFSNRRETDRDRQTDRETDRQGRRKTERDKEEELGLVENTRDVFSAYPLSALIIDCSLGDRFHLSSKDCMRHYAQPRK